MKMRKLLLSSLLLTAFNTNVNATTFTIDGNLADWGITASGNDSDWTPNAGIHYVEEDQNTYFLSPGYGGQAYDAEALYAHTDTASNTLYIALATGHNPEKSNSGGSFGAGDFAIDFGADGTYEVGINVKPSWDGFGTAAEVYEVTEWDYGIWGDNQVPGYVRSEHPTSIISGNSLGLAQLAISDAEQGYGEFNSTQDHYFYELAFDLNFLVNAGWTGGQFNIHWTENCANDSVLLSTSAALPTTSPQNVPEPATLALLLLGVTGLRLTSRKKVIS